MTELYFRTGSLDSTRRMRAVKKPRMEVCHRYQIREEKVEYHGSLRSLQLSFDENYSFGEFLENHSNFYFTLHWSE